MPFALRDVGNVEIAEAFAVEGFDVPTLGGEHAPDLMVFAFNEGEFGDAGGANDQFGGCAGGFLALELKRAGGEEGDEGLVQVAIDGGAVDLVDLVFGRGEAVNELGLVGEQDRPAGVFIESADGRDDGVAGAPARGEETVDRGAFADFVGADEAKGFVEQKEDTVEVVEGFAIDEHAGGMGLGGGVAGGNIVDGEPAIADPTAGIAAGAVTKIGEELIETTHGIPTE